MDEGQRLEGLGRLECVCSQWSVVSCGLQRGQDVEESCPGGTGVSTVAPHVWTSDCSRGVCPRALITEPPLDDWSSGSRAQLGYPYRPLILLCGFFYHSWPSAKCASTLVCLPLPEWRSVRAGPSRISPEMLAHRKHPQNIVPGGAGSAS